MSTVELTAETFEKAIAEHDMVLVDWWASWCGPCRAFAPVYDKSSEQHPDIVFGKVDTEAEQELAAAVQITSIPTVMAFREGILVFAQPGALPAAALDDVIGQLKDLDMDQVRAKVAAEEAAREPAGTSTAQEPAADRA